MASREEVEQAKRLPHVGSTVRSRKYGTLWRVMEKREMWEHFADNPNFGTQPAGSGYLPPLLENPRGQNPRYRKNVGLHLHSSG